MLKPSPIDPVPEATARVAKAAFRKGNPLLSLRDELGAVFADADFADLFPGLGQPGGDREAQRGRAAGVADRRARADGFRPDQGPRARASAALDLEGRAARGYCQSLNAMTVRRRLPPNCKS